MLVENRHLKRVAFWPLGNKDRVGGHDVYPWNFYWMSIESLDGCPVPWEEVPEDASRIGSDFRRLASRFETRQSCNCFEIQTMLDEANVDFISRHTMRISGLICESAAKLGWSVTESQIRRILDFLIVVHKVKRWTGFVSATDRAAVRGEVE